VIDHDAPVAVAANVAVDKRCATSRERVGVFVTFRYGDDFDEQTLRRIAETACGRFEGMPGLHSKAFTLHAGRREAANFYVWDSEDAARAFFSDEMLERVTHLYGVRPSIESVRIAALVENTVA
jgi:heme-degrading monooxygenase HmoA